MSFNARSRFYTSKVFYAFIAVIVIAVVAVIVLSSGSSDKKTPTTSSTTSTTAQERVYFPLTGLEDPTGEGQTRPALAVKIGNNPEARPQAGITEADIMYEEIVEGGITRYMGIFHSTVPERVGPVRSVRGMDPNIALNWGGVFAYSGGAAKNEDKIKNTSGVLALNETAAGNGMKRDSSRGAPNNLYAIPSVLFEKDGTPIPPVKQFTFSSVIPKSADAVSSFLVGFTAGFEVTWTYDATTGKYLRSYKDKAVVDQNSKQVAVDNVVVQFINYPSESEGITTGSGDVWVFRNGKVVKGTWNRPTTSKPAVFTDESGKEIALAPGQTWVELVKTTTTVTTTP